MIFFSVWWKKWLHKPDVDVSNKMDRNEDVKIRDSDMYVEPVESSRKWPTSWFWQLLVLIVRTFRQSRHVILSKLNLIQTILLAVIVSLIWFQVPEDEMSVNDRHGYVCCMLLIIIVSDSDYYTCRYFLQTFSGVFSH